jgi:hypothetical protein
MTSTDINLLYQQMGEVLRGLRSLGEVIELRDAQAAKLQDLVRADLLTLRQDQRDLEEKLDCVACVMQADVQALRSDASQAGRAMSDLVSAVQALRAPVAEMVALRSRAAGVVLGLGVFGSALLWLAEPVYRWVIEHEYLKQ